MAPDEFYDDEGNLCVQYPLDDDPDLQGPVSTRAQERAEEITQERPRPSRKKGVGKNRCSKCNQIGHNKRTCGTIPPEVAAIEVPKIPPSQVSENISVEIEKTVKLE